MALVIIIIKAIPRLCGVNIVSPERLVWETLRLASLRSGESSDLLTANSRYKKLQEAVSVNIYADFCIGRNLVDALDHIAVSVKDIALNLSVAISHRFAAGELSSS